MTNLIGFPEEKLKQLFADWGLPGYRAHQVFSWIYHHGARRFEEMTNLSKDLRSRLTEHFVMGGKVET
jgi:23S rRNA (adenine2503-C2)-methyltransferase